LLRLPIHASWLNQIELYFSIVQRKALSPNSFDSLDELADRWLRFGEHYRQIARPFDWTFTRADLERVLAKITEREPACACGVTDRDRVAVSRLKGAARGR